MLLSKKEHRRIHNGWRLIKGEWWKTCSRCNRFLLVEENFYKRYSGNNEFVTQCKKCMYEIGSMRKKTQRGQYFKIELRCGWCQKIMSPGRQPASHGLCHFCRMLYFPETIRPALMKPATSRLECFDCPHVVNDSDGVPESCDLLRGEPCVYPDRRNPWGNR
jgi:RNase P subunit RPR2